MELKTTDLIVDEVYGGSRNGNASDDPLPALLGVDNGAGFRHLGKRPSTDTLNLLVLKSNFNDPDWPDHFDHRTGILTYYGDNKKPGDLHSTPRQGNLILKNLFDAAKNSSWTENFPVILLFGGTGVYRDVRFLGLAVPGSSSFGSDDNLVALWRSSGTENIRFQNYKALFTVLDVPIVSRAWLDDVKIGRAAKSIHAPQQWLNWLKTRRYEALLAPHSLETRTKAQQVPASGQNKKIVELVYDTYREDPFGFEKCAMAIAQLTMPNIESFELTRPWRDGGRDAIGKYKIGSGFSSIEVDFALEAKCYHLDNGVGVKPLSRLISRIKHRQFGILVTTSYLSNQAYKELKEDLHPVVVISAIDIAKILRERVSADIITLKKWIKIIGE